MMSKTCKMCDQMVIESDVFCKECGHRLKETSKRRRSSEGDTFGYAVLGFVIPIAGLTLYLAWLEYRPKAANSAGKGALASVVLGIIFMIVTLTIMATSTRVTLNF